MVILMIEQPGLYLNLPGMNKKVRTPISLDISRLNISNIISHLKNLGISNYKIISDNDDHKAIGLDSKFFSTTKNKTKRNIQQPNVNEIKNKDLDNLNQQMSTIQLMLKKIIEKDPEKQIIYNTFGSNRNQVEELKNKNLKEDHFIPKIDISNMDIKSTTTKKVAQESEQNIDDIADLLRSNLENS